MTVTHRFGPTARKAPRLVERTLTDTQWTQNERDGETLRMGLRTLGIALVPADDGRRSPYYLFSESYAACLLFGRGDRAAGTGSRVRLVIFRLVGNKIGPSAFVYSLLPPFGDRPWGAYLDRFGDSRHAFRGLTPRLPETCADEAEARAILGTIAGFCARLPEYRPTP